MQYCGLDIDAKLSIKQKGTPHQCTKTTWLVGYAQAGKIKNTGALRKVRTHKGYDGK